MGPGTPEKIKSSGVCGDIIKILGLPFFKQIQIYLDFLVHLEKNNYKIYIDYSACVKHKVVHVFNECKGAIADVLFHMNHYS